MPVSALQNENEHIYFRCLAALEIKNNPGKYDGFFCDDHGSIEKLGNWGGNGSLVELCHATGYSVVVLNMEYKEIFKYIEDI